MPWKKSEPKEQKHRFVSLAGTGKFTVTELCSEFHVSRKTAYKWLKRFGKDGAAGLCDRTRVRTGARIKPRRRSSD